MKMMSTQKINASSMAGEVWSCSTVLPCALSNYLAKACALLCFVVVVWVCILYCARFFIWKSCSSEFLFRWWTKNNAMDRTVLTYQCDMDTGAGVNVRLVCVSMFWQNFWGYTLRVSMSDSFVCLCFGRIFGDTLVWFFKSLSHRMFGCQF